jgi:hypothetical protein
MIMDKIIRRVGEEHPRFSGLRRNRGEDIIVVGLEKKGGGNLCSSSSGWPFW